MKAWVAHPVDCASEPRPACRLLLQSRRPEAGGPAGTAAATPPASPRRRVRSRPYDLDLEAPAVALEQPAQLGACDERDHHVADRVRDVEGKAAGLHCD